MEHEAAASPSPDLVRLQNLLWLHSALGTALGMTCFWAVVARKPTALQIGLVGCLVAWTAGLAPLGKKAETLASEDRVPSRGVPRWALVTWSLAETLSLGIWGFTSWLPWLFVAHVLLGGTLVLRGILSGAMDVPFHVRTWGISLSIVGLVLMGQIFCGMVVTVGRW